jgi:hypothetical protein
MLKIHFSVLISVDAMALHAVGCRRQTIHQRLCWIWDCPDVPFHCKLTSGWKCARVSFRIPDLFHVLWRLICRTDGSKVRGATPIPMLLLINPIRLNIELNISNRHITSWIDLATRARPRWSTMGRILRSLYQILETRPPSKVILEYWSLKDKVGLISYISLAAIMDFGFHTHALNLDNKYVGLVSSYNSATKELTITGRE